MSSWRKLMNASEGGSGPDKLPEQPERVAASRPANSQAESILALCTEYGVAIRLDPDGTVAVGRADAKADEPTQPWPALIAAIEANLDAVADLIEAGWILKAEWNP